MPSSKSGNELAARLDAEALVRVFDEAASKIRRACELLCEAEEILTATFDGDTYGKIRISDCYNRVNFHDPEGMLSEVRRELWGALVERLELRRFMSIGEWDSLQRKIRDDREVPEITIENVIGMADGFRQRMPEMLEAAVREVYDWLRPHHNRYKTNDRWAVGDKVIIAWMVEKSFGKWHIRYSSFSDPEQRLTALENVFTALDGRGQITKGHYSEISQQIKALPQGAKCEGETPYFKWRGFRNGNLHIAFKRRDLVLRFNQIAGARSLKGAA